MFEEDGNQVTWLDDLDSELDRLEATSGCFTCRLARRAGSAHENAMNLVNANADQYLVNAAIKVAREALADARAAADSHTCE